MTALILGEFDVRRLAHPLQRAIRYVNSALHCTWRTIMAACRPCWQHSHLGQHARSQASLLLSPHDKDVARYPLYDS